MSFVLLIPILVVCASLCAFAAVLTAVLSASFHAVSGLDGAPPATLAERERHEYLNSARSTR